MVSKEEKFICNFETGKNYSQLFFTAILKSTLNYKYSNFNSSAVPSSGKDITNAIFCLSAKDSLSLFNKNINGQKIKELFITAVYLKYLDATNTDKLIFVAIPFIEESYDVAIYITEKGNFQYIKNGDRCKLSDRHTAYYIQVKEEFDYNASKNNFQKLKNGLNIKSFEKKVADYTELMLIFIRDYCKYDTDEAKSFLEKNKNVGLISMPSLEQKEILVTDGIDKGKKIILDEGKYNFFIYSENQTAHIRFSVPDFLIPII